MPTYLKKKFNKAKWFVAGMGTVLSVAPMTTIAQPSVTTADRLAMATTRVGARFTSVLNQQGPREQAKKKAP